MLPFFFVCFCVVGAGIVVRGSSVCVARTGICEWGVCWRRRGVVVLWRGIGGVRGRRGAG